VIELLDELGLERPHVAGNSLGGWIAYELAKAGRARSATGLSPAGFWSGPFEGAFSRLSLFLGRRTARLALPYADWLVASPFRRKLAFNQFAAHPERMPADDAALHLRGLAQAPAFDSTLLAMIGDRFQHGERIGVPATIAWGELDRLRQALWAAHLIPQARSVVLFGCGHVPTYDDPEQVAAVILQGSSS
jgi:pimeloyl-ACP methyl ester carboxylesterase